MWFKKRSLFKKRSREERVAYLEEAVSDMREDFRSMSYQFVTSQLHHEIRQQLGVELSIGFDIYYKEKDSLIGRDEDTLFKLGFKFYGPINHYTQLHSNVVVEVWARPSKKFSHIPHFGPSPGDG